MTFATTRSSPPLADSGSLSARECRQQLPSPSLLLSLFFPPTARSRPGFSRPSWECGRSPDDDDGDDGDDDDGDDDDDDDGDDDDDDDDGDDGDDDDDDSSRQQWRCWPGSRPSGCSNRLGSPFHPPSFSSLQKAVKMTSELQNV